MITVKDINVGFIRYDLFNNYFAIDIYIENIFSERGVSRIVMSKTMHHMKKKTGVKIFRAYVKKKNSNSINFFKSLKFNYNQSYFEKKI
jgi:L-amino acid N-acyltransferase YncA